jgi:hypothetical protein
MENQQLAFSSQQCTSTPVGFGQGFLSRETLENQTCSPILAAADFYLFPPLQSAMK